MDIAEAIARYDALLADDPALGLESGAQLMAAQPAARLLFGGRAMCTCLRPNLIDAAQYAMIGTVSAVLAGAARTLEAAMLADSRLLDELDLSEGERRLALVDPGFADAAASSRLDSFISGDSWQFVEYNAESPAGMAYTDTLAELFHDLPVMRSFERHYTLRDVPSCPSMLDVLLGAYREWGGRGTPLIAIVDWGGLPTANEFELFREYFARNGISSLILQPSELEYRGGRLYGGGRAIDLVYRRVLTHELLARLDEAPALTRAYEDHAICVVNAFRCKLMHKKAIFALLSDDAHAALFSAEERQAIARHIPWTRKVREGYTSHAGKTVDLVAHVLAQRENLVLKPNDEYGGRGVVLGWETDETGWETALRQALEGSYVVQERVPTSRASFPVYLDGRVQAMQLITDLDPYLFGRRVAGMLARVSPVALLNVTAGTASTLPTFIIESRND